MYDLIVVGGGAAGIFAALACAEARPGLRVLVLEKGSALLAKVRVSGGGRCNLTHACFDPARLVQYYPRGSTALRGSFARFQPRDTMEWFERRGVALKTEADGRVFPRSDRSETIIACLLAEADRLGVEVRIRSAVGGVIARGPGQFEVQLVEGVGLAARCVLLATGGERGGYQFAADLGQTVLPPVPSLFTFQVTDARLQELAGVSVPDGRARFTDLRMEQRGPILVTHWGFSGPAILRLSAWAARGLFEHSYQAELEINWLGDMAVDPLVQQLTANKAAHGRKQIAVKDPTARIPARLWKSLVTAAGISNEQVWASASRVQLLALARQLVQGRYEVNGKGEFKEEFVTCGGVVLDEVDLRLMESKKTKGLFFGGEILDIDGVTGGFNLQSAWTSGWLAGRSAAERSLEFKLSGQET